MGMRVRAVVPERISLVRVRRKESGEGGIFEKTDESKKKRMREILEKTE